MEKHDEQKENSLTMTWAQKLEEAEAREKYILEHSREEGRQEGEQKGKIELIGQQLKQKYQVDASTWLTTLSIEQLNKVSTLVLTCYTFEDLQNQIISLESFEL